MKALLLILHISALASCHSQKNKATDQAIISSISNRTSLLQEDQVKSLDSLDINFQVRGFCYAYSSDKNAIASNGEAHSNNKAQKTNDDFPGKGLYMTINEKEFTRIDKQTLGQKLYMVNKSDSSIVFNAQDSRIDIIPEALDRNGVWKPIGYLPFSDCGNSYHKIKLDSNEFWAFAVPVFKGNFKTKIRYTLYSGLQPWFSSNEITSFINESQFDKKNRQGHTASNIMDPYTD